MTEASDSSEDRRAEADQPILGAGIKGVGPRLVHELEAIEITKVEQLADADVSELVRALRAAHPRFKPETLHLRAKGLRSSAQRFLSSRSESARERRAPPAKSGTSRPTTRETAPHASGAANPESDEPHPHELRRARQGHVFLVTVRLDADGQPETSQFRYGSGQTAPTGGDATQVIRGWSPEAFSEFVERTLGLSAKRASKDDETATVDHEGAEGDTPTESHHRVQGPWVRGSDDERALEVSVPTDQLGLKKGTRIGWRASGRMVPFGDGERKEIILGGCAGDVRSGEPIQMRFRAPSMPDRFYRAWFDVVVGPAVDSLSFPTVATGGMAPEPGRRAAS